MSAPSNLPYSSDYSSCIKPSKKLGKSWFIDECSTNCAIQAQNCETNKAKENLICFVILFSFIDFKLLSQNVAEV